MKRSPLHEHHRREGGKMAPFAGWEMPIRYEGIVAEHKAVRSGVGVFDISHMGEIVVSGSNAESWLNGLLTNEVSRLGEGEGQYTLLLDEEGGVIDDLILFREGADSFFLVVNASRVDEDLDWLQRHGVEGVGIENLSDSYGALAVQGPGSAELWKAVSPGPALPQRNGIFRSPEGTLILCRTGYTGEDGFELFCPAAEAGSWWDRVREAGAKPCGLGARDTLRLEKGYPLNGNDLDRKHTPLEAGLGFFVDLEKSGGFIGSGRLLEQKRKGLGRRLAGLRMTRKGPPPRHGYEVRDGEGEAVLGILSSGSLSPTLGVGIGMAYLDASVARPGTALTLAIRDRIYPAEVVKMPFC